VSRLWRDQLRLALSPERVVAVRISGGLRPRLLAKQIISCKAGTPNWHGVVESISEALLTRAEWQDAQARVVLSNHFVRYQLLPWSDEISSDEELLAYARQSFGQVHGEAAKSWAVTVDVPHRGEPTLASAMDRALSEELDEAFAASKTTLVSVQPYLASIYNKQRGSFADESAWFVMVENGKLLLSLITDEHWRSIAVRNVSMDGWQEELPLMLDREWRLKGIAEGPRLVYLYGPEVRNAPLLNSGKWRFEWLRPKLTFGLSPQTDAPYVMALEG
jgi:hypothetical protein